MPEYLSPGVYMEEFEIGARPIEGVSTSTAGFLGETERGPTTPRLVTSWLQFQRIYGGYFGTEKYLPAAVEGFFNNGGSRCYIARIVKVTGMRASLAMHDFPTNDSKNLTVKAIGEGAWGKRVAVNLSGSESGRIKLDVLYWKTIPPKEADLVPSKINETLKKNPPTVSETFENVSTSKTSSDHYESTVNGISNLITISSPEADCKNLKSGFIFLTEGENGGSEAQNASLTLRAIDAFTKLDEYKDHIMILKAKGVGKKGEDTPLSLTTDGSKYFLNVVTTDGSQTNIEIKAPINDFLTEASSKSIDVEIDVISDPHKDAVPINGTSKLTDTDENNKACITLRNINGLTGFDKLPKEDSFKDMIMKVTAVEDQDGHDITVKIEKGTSSGIKLTVILKNDETMAYDNMSLEDLKTEVNRSPHVNISIDPDYQIASEGSLKLIDGKDSDPSLNVGDYIGIPDLGSRTGLTAFTEIEDISIVYAPNANSVDGLVLEIISHCELLRYRFAIIDADKGRSSTDNNNLDPKNYYTATDHAAFYYPWIKVVNPETGMLQPMPPGGYVAGIYARSDIERGVHKAPANEIVRGASDLEFQIKKEQDILNPRGVNVIRAFSGRGILVWGARTLSSNTLWKYINVRRLFIYVEASIERGTQWVVFEPNDDRLWSRVIATITQFLTGVWRSGALMGKTPEEAFFVKCDRSTMTQDDIDNGRLICIIGIAPVKPAEFVIFRVAQWQGGSAATE